MDEQEQDQRAQLEALCDRSMPGLRRHSIGDWILRASLGATGRANSVWIGGSPEVPINDAVDQVEAWYQDQELHPLFQVFGEHPDELSTELDKRGYGTIPGAIILVGAIEKVRAESDPYRVVPRPTRCWPEPASAYTGLIGNDDRVAELTTTDLDQRCVVTFSETEEPLCGGMATLDGDWLGLFAMLTVPAARRQGLASVVLNELVRRGIEGGAKSAWLQVMPDNDAAIALYQGLGMVEAHRYHYRFAPKSSGQEGE